jgi:branched-chain amino acid transport system substrate-binding protein
MTNKISKYASVTRRSFIAAGATGAAVSVLGAGAGPARAVDPIRIGYTMPRTGFLGVACPVAEQAYLMWREQVNAQGGLNIGGKGARPIEFVSYDDQSDPAKCAQIYSKLITQDKVELLLAPYATPFHLAIGPLLERSKFPVVGNTAASTLLRDLKAKYFFFVETLPDRIRADIVNFLEAQHVKSIAMITLQLPASLETKKYTVPLLEKAKINVLVNLEYPPDLKDMTSMVSSVKNAAPDAVIGLCYPGDSVMYMSTARELGVNIPIQLLLIGPSEPFFAKKFPEKDLDGIVTLGRWSPNQSKWPEAKPFFDAYSARWKEPPDYLDSVSAYASCQVLQQAVAKAGVDHEKLRSALANDSFATINGPIKFTGAVNLETVSGLLQLQASGVEIIWPPSIATKPFAPKTGWS